MPMVIDTPITISVVRALPASNGTLKRRGKRKGSGTERE